MLIKYIRWMGLWGQKEMKLEMGKRVKIKINSKTKQTMKINTTKELANLLRSKITRKYL